MLHQSMEENLKKHIDSLHRGIKQFKCGICEYKCARKDDLKRHVESVHEGHAKPVHNDNDSTKNN